MATETTEKPITITVELTEQQAHAFAQYFKRTGYMDYRASACSPTEANLMQDAANKTQNALAGAGFSPR